jgi:predicted TIM-barrel fold metal-dependent hydrolase
MTMPAGIGIIDCMMAVPPKADDRSAMEMLRPQLRDRESREDMVFPAQYLFRDLPEARFQEDTVAAVLNEMDRWGVERSMIGVNSKHEAAQRALQQYPDRFFGSYEVNPNRGMDAVRGLRRAFETWGVKAATGFPAGAHPQAPINDKRWYPIYATCVDLGIPICMCAGVPGPRVPMACQDVALIDEVCWFFPELVFVTRHGCEPWTDLAVKLMLKWPNLYYSTSAFAPKHYPRDIIDYANTRGADKIIYAGYFPMGLSLERIMTEMQNVPFHDDVWPKFLRENALRVFNLDQ